MTVHTNCSRRETETVRGRRKRRKRRRWRAREQGGYRVVGLVDAQDEDQLGEEERSRSVVDDAGLVALQGPQAEQEDGGEEQEAQRHSHRAPRQHLDGQNLSVLHGGQNYSKFTAVKKY